MNQIIRPRESLALYKSFNALWLTSSSAWHPRSSPWRSRAAAAPWWGTWSPPSSRARTGAAGVFLHTAISPLCYKLTYIKYICSVAWLGLILTFQRDGLLRENPSKDYLQEVGYLPGKNIQIMILEFSTGWNESHLGFSTLCCTSSANQLYCGDNTTKILNHDDAPTRLMLVSVTSQ